MPNIGAPGYILLVILALLLFGPNKLPELGRAVGRTFREFKEGARDIIAEPEQASKNGVQQASAVQKESAAGVPGDKQLPE